MSQHDAGKSTADAIAELFQEHVLDGDNACRSGCDIDFGDGQHSDSELELTHQAQVVSELLETRERDAWTNCGRAAQAMIGFPDWQLQDILAERTPVTP